MTTSRQLAAIMFTDIVGYTALMGRDSAKALELIHISKEIQKPLVERYNGQWLKEMGDGVLVKFSTALDAVNCAVDIQKTAGVKFDGKLRIGIHLGDVTVENEDVYGDGVNVASRLESITDPGGIYISDAIEKAIRGQSKIETYYLGEQQLKNVDYGVRTYALQGGNLPSPAQTLLPKSMSPTSKEGGARRLKSKMAYFTITALAVVLAIWYFFAYVPNLQQLVSGDDFASKERSIAVLPFVNMSPDPDNEYFSDGMTQELCNRLSRIQNLRLTSRLACLRFKGSTLSPAEIAKELGVEYLIDGSVRKFGNKVRINAQLIEAATGFELASYDFDGNLEGALEAQDRAALSIAEELQLDLGAEEVVAIQKRYTDNNQAYNAYLKGWMLLESLHSNLQPSSEKLDAAKQHFEEALAQDSSYAKAYAGLSIVESLHYFYGYQKEYDRLERAENLARQALKLDGNLPEGHLALAEFFTYSGRHEEAIKSYRVSLDSKPDNPIGWCHLSYTCRISDPIDLDGAEYAARMAIKQQPTYIWSYLNLGAALWLKEQFAEAIKAYQYCIELNPNWLYPYLSIGSIQLTQGDYDLAMEMFQQADKLSDTPDINVKMSFVYAEQGEKELALTELEKAFKAGYSNFDLIESIPHYHSIRNDDEFKTLISKFKNQETH